MTGRKNKPGAIGLGGLTPLLDTLFLLLFSVLALSDVRDPKESEAVQIELPLVEPSQDIATEQRQLIALTVDADGRVRRQDSAAVIQSPQALDGELVLMLNGALPNDVVVEIRGHRQAPHGVAVALLQHLRVRGFADIQLLATGYEHPANLFGQEQP